MAALSGVTPLADTQVPVRLHPRPPGHWRMVGTRTCVFEPEGPFPASTRYTLDIPVGTRSREGGALAAPVTWSFTTAPLHLRSSWPEGVYVPLDPVMVAVFDQAVDPAVLMPTVRILVNGRRVGVRPATPQEVAGCEKAVALLRASPPGHAVVFRPLAALPRDTLIRVIVGPGPVAPVPPEPSRGDDLFGVFPHAPLPGRDPGDHALEFAFRTFGPLRARPALEGSPRAWDLLRGGVLLGSNQPLVVRFSNPLDSSTVTPACVRVEPPLAGFRLTARSTYLVLRGLVDSTASYRVFLGAGIRDVFGQELGESPPLEFAPQWPPRLGVRLVSFGAECATLEPAAARTVSVTTSMVATLRVTLHAVTPADWPRYREIRRRDRDGTMPLPGKAVWEGRVSTTAPTDRLTHTPINLQPALPRGIGHVIVAAEPVDDAPHPVGPRPRNRRALCWVQATRIGLDAWTDGDTFVGWATDLQDGHPLPGVALSLLSSRASGRLTDSHGLARLRLSPSSDASLVARLADDSAILEVHGCSQAPKPTGPTLLWYAFTDRDLVRPGDLVHLKGWLRQVPPHSMGNLQAVAPGLGPVHWSLVGPGGTVFAHGLAPVDSSGGFHASLRIPQDVPLGSLTLALRVPGSPRMGWREHELAIRVEDFRRPDVKIHAQVSGSPHFLGSHATVTVSSDWYAGGALPAASLHWDATARPCWYAPPGCHGFAFGPARPDWQVWTGGEFADTQRLDARLDSAGRTTLGIDVATTGPPRPVLVDVDARVQNVDRQEVALVRDGTASLLLHPSSLYVGLKASRLFVAPGEPIDVDAIVTDLDGHPVKGCSITLRSARLEWPEAERETEVDSRQTRLESQGDAVRWSFAPPTPGVWRITARVEDTLGRPNETEMLVWASGAGPIPQPLLEPDEVTLVPERQQVREGETAEILVVAPFHPAEGVVTVSQGRLLHSECFRVEGPSRKVRVQVPRDAVPGIDVQVDLVGETERRDRTGRPDPALPKRPAFASGKVHISVPPTERRLSVEVTPRDPAVEPGARTSVDVRVKDARGFPVPGAHVSLAVVDEAALSLTGYRPEDPVTALLARPYRWTCDSHGRVGLVFDPAARDRLTSARLVHTPIPPGATAGWPPPPLLIDGGRPPASEAPALALRRDFSATAAFCPDGVTDSEGRTRFPVTLPGTLTRYRVTALAVAGSRQSGLGEGTLVARLPLASRPSPPRFLRRGDVFDFSVVVQNRTADPVDAEVAVRADGVRLAEGAGRVVTVPADDRAEVRFPGEAPRLGIARVQAAAVAGTLADVAEVGIPVHLPTTTETTATCGRLQDDVRTVEVQVPPDALPDVGGLQITTSSTLMPSLVGVEQYLQSYPYACTEQIASRLLAAVLRADRMKVAGDRRGCDETSAAVRRDILRLQALQRGRAGFGTWGTPEERTWPFGSIYACHVLALARSRGFEVSEGAVADARSYLVDGLDDWHLPDCRPATRRALRMYALHVRRLLGIGDAEAVKRLLAEAGGPGGLGLEGSAWALQALGGDPASADAAAALRAYLDRHISQEASTARLEADRADSATLLLSSRVRAEATVLDALVADRPRSALIPQLVRGLLDSRTNGRWGNTQENALALLALDHYSRACEPAPPDFVAGAWLDGHLVASHGFQGRGAAGASTTIPMEALLEMASPTGARRELVLAREGAGTLHYRVSMTHASRNPMVEAADCGFGVTRTYEPVDDASDVRRDADGTWRVRAGARVRVCLTMAAHARRSHVALCDPLPAGFEALHPGLSLRANAPNERAPQPGEEAGPWFDHQELRDDRVQVFAAEVHAGVHVYRYLARATTMGRFVAPATTVEEMYHPETCGRTSSDRVLVETPP